MIIFPTLAFIAIMCFIGYKITAYFIDKFIDFTLKFPSTASLMMAAFFSIAGLIQLDDFYKEIHLDLAIYFPLSFLVSTFFLVASVVFKFSKRVKERIKHLNKE